MVTERREVKLGAKAVRDNKCVGVVSNPDILRETALTHQLTRGKVRERAVVRRVCIMLIKVLTPQAQMLLPPDPIRLSKA